MVSPNTVLGHYSIVRKIGAGGMGEVYLAHDQQLDRKVAVKLLLAEVSSNQERMRRFVQEAKAASALNHPNIITIHEIGAEDGHQFIATEFIEGHTLRNRLRTGIDLDEALAIAIQVTSALVAAHRVNIIHRDIKPENIMIRNDDGVVKLLDFGLAKISVPRRATIDPEADTQLRNTAPGVVMGTVAYMSPEQARGETVDERTDIWSLGVVLYEMIAGCSPFVAGTSNEIISAILSKQTAPPLARYADSVPERMEEIVEKALTKNKDERYQTSKDLLIDLKRLQQTLQLKAASERSAAPDRSGIQRLSQSDKLKF
ncbi:MAG TPA: serine/threonine-protein kinase, partial [Pyrinomonadaceae bacterium]|nr:serine/threonine-protein kinase [Pyrinomonadaceae bacterium]